jgi:hypothetical protein
MDDPLPSFVVNVVLDAIAWLAFFILSCLISHGFNIMCTEIFADGSLTFER